MVTKKCALDKLLSLGLLIGILIIARPVAYGCDYQCASCTMNCDTLMRVDQANFGGPVRSVAWLCDNCQSIRFQTQYVAVGGYAEQGNDVVIYKIGLQENIEKVVQVNLGSFVLALDWCIIDQVPYLAVAGSATDAGYNVNIFRFDIVPTPTLTLVASFNNQADVYAVSWLCKVCTNVTVQRYLAIGGNPATTDQADIRILLFTASEQEYSLVETSHKVHGAPIYSLDWHIPEIGCPLLAVGGRSSTIECNDVNVRVFSLDCCKGYLLPVTNQRHTAPVVNAVKWSCRRHGDSDTYLAIGGATSDSDNANIRLYKFLSGENRLLEVAKVSDNPLKQIFAVNWFCDDSDAYVTVGGGCTCTTSSQACIPNIYVYKDEIVHGTHQLRLINEEKFDDVATSLDWCRTDDHGCAYLMVGMENDFCCAVACQTNECSGLGQDLVLYKAKLGCHTDVHPCPPAPRPHPVPCCDPCVIACDYCYDSCDTCGDPIAFRELNNTESQKREKYKKARALRRAERATKALQPTVES